jgi:hypothetical protein
MARKFQPVARLNATIIARSKLIFETGYYRMINLNRALALLLWLALVVSMTTSSFGDDSVKNDFAKFDSAKTNKSDKASKPNGAIADPALVGGESSSVIKVANLVYAGTKTSECFSDHFLRRAEEASSLSTSRRLHSVKLASDEVYNFPMIIMNGEGEFTLLAQERDNLRRFIQRGGFLLASAGCSSKEWNQSFRREMAMVFPEQSLKKIGLEHLVFHTVYDIAGLNAKHGTPKQLEGLHFGTRLGVLYSQDGLNDTSNTQGCCCCGGNEITNAEQINVNVLIYSLLQ